MKSDGTRREIEELFIRIDSLYWGPEERSLIDRAIELSREIADEQLEYRARMRLTASAAQLGDTDAMLSSFVWCLAKHDADPHTFPSDIENGSADLMWHFKWMIGAFDSNSMFSLEQADAMLADMEAHYRKEGLGLSGVLTARFHHAWHIGQIEEAIALRTQLLATPRDEHSHCDACGRSELASFAFETGAEAEAIRLVNEIVEGGYSCGEEPEGALGDTLIAKLRAGELEDARASHLRSYRMSRTNPDRISIVAANIAFTAITGNEARGLAMVERHIGWLSHDPLNEEGSFKLLLATGQVLEAVIAAGHGEQVVRGAGQDDLVPFFGERQTPWTVCELAPAVWAAATQIAASFDHRNGNDYVSGRIAKAKELLAEHYDVPINSDAFLAAPPPADPDPTDSLSWANRAITYLASGMLDEALQAASQALNSADNPLTLLRAQAVAISILTLREDYVEAEKLLKNRILILREQGENLQADVEEQLGLGLFGRYETADIAAMEACLQTWNAPNGSELAYVQHNLSCAYYQNDLETEKSEQIVELHTQARENSRNRPELYMDTLFAFASGPASNLEQAMEALAELLEMDLPAGLRAAGLRKRARFYGGQEEYLAGAADADEATRINAALRFHGPTAATADLAGRLLLDAGHSEEATNRFRYAIREAEQLNDERPLGLIFNLGKALLAGGHASEAVECFGEVYQLESESKVEPAARADTLGWLGRAYYDSEQYGSAVGCWSQSAELYEEAERPDDAADALLRKGNLLRNFSEYADAREALTHALELVENEPEWNGLQVRILESLGSTKSQDEDDSGLADFDRAIKLAKADDQEWTVADLLDSKARALAALSRYDAAVAEFLNAGDAYQGAGDSFAAARAEFFAGQVTTAELNRNEEAVALMTSALERVKGSENPNAPSLQNAIALQLGDVLEALGRMVEATQIRSEVRED